MGAEMIESSAADGGGGGREMAARRARMAGLAAEREQVRFGRAVPPPLRGQGDQPRRPRVRAGACWDMCAIR